MRVRDKELGLRILRSSVFDVCMAERTVKELPQAEKEIRRFYVQNTRQSVCFKEEELALALRPEFEKLRI